ncbi:hypothetical protein FOZ63_011402 [Perkinsus olseni]|uniref:Uncharacterized protein n=1 Tax=Perkinsus olseni TaxID=32597 RepID=A0A7J6U6D3_PEROL|nr:hypothetical protein FOZ63_011402 [Perkinsus olseni]
MNSWATGKGGSWPCSVIVCLGIAPYGGFLRPFEIRSELAAEDVLRKFFPRQSKSGTGVEAAEKERLHEVRKISSIPSSMVPIHNAYMALVREEGKPSNYEGQLKAAKQLLEAVEARIRRLWDPRKLHNHD